MGKRLIFLDVAKGIGILLVLMGHSCGFIFGGDYITSFYMAMFFVVSGYVYSPSGRSGVENIKKRLKRILVPYFSYNVLLFGYYLLKGIVAGDFEFTDTLTAVIGVFYSRNFLWVGRDDNIYFFRLLNDPVWFLTAMCSASVIFYAVVDKCLESLRKCVFISVILLGMAAVMSFLPVLLPWSIDSAPLFSLFMIMGAVLGKKEYFQSEHSVSHCIFTGIAVMVSVLLCGINGKANLSVRVYGDYPVISVLFISFIGAAGSVLTIWISKLLCRMKLLEGLLSCIGRNTLPIMALHMAVFQVTDKVISAVLGNVSENAAVYWGYAVLKMIAAVSVSMAVSAVAKKLFGKMSVIKRK